MQNTHSKRATVALRKLSEFDPAMASLSLWAHHRDTNGTDVTAATIDAEGNVETFRKKVEFAPAYTNGSIVWYGTKFATWTLEEKMAVCAHEIMHISLRHVTRGKKLAQRLGNLYDAEVFNIATDAIINETLRLVGYQLPGNVVFLVELFEKTFGEKIKAEDAIGQWDAEKLYMRIMNERKSQAGSGQGQSSSAGGGQGGSEQGDSDGDQSEGGDGSGSGAGESQADKAKAYAKDKDFHHDMDTSGPLSPNDAQEDSEWQQRLERALRQSSGRQAGTGIGRLGHKIADIPKSRTPWELLLRRMINKAITRSPRPTYTSPARRWIGAEDNARRHNLPTPAFEPGFVKQNAQPRVVVGVDVSGSIGDQELEIFCGEISAIGRKTGCEIHVLVFDTQVLSQQKLENADLEREIRKIDFARGGGTSFVDVLQKAKEIDPSIIVILTDLYGPFGEDPGVPVIWASPEETPPEPPFGTLLSLTA